MLSYVSEQTNLTKFLKHSSVAVTSQLVVAFLFSRSIYVLRKLTYLGVIVSTCYIHMLVQVSKLASGMSSSPL